MKNVINILGGLTAASIVTTGMMIVIDQSRMVPAFALSSVVLVGLMIAAKWIDMRVRGMLVTLIRDIMIAAEEADKPLVYHDAQLLLVAIADGMSLTTASIEVGHLSERMEMPSNVMGSPL